MYKSIKELLEEVKSIPDTEGKINKLKSIGNAEARFKAFIKWAYFNTKQPSFTSIPDYKPNMVDITFSYIKLEKAILSLKYFFPGKDFISHEKKRRDKLLTILEEMSWLETYIYEQLVLNRYQDKELPMQIVETAFPELKEKSINA